MRRPKKGVASATPFFAWEHPTRYSNRCFSKFDRIGAGTFFTRVEGAGLEYGLVTIGIECLHWDSGSSMSAWPSGRIAVPNHADEPVMVERISNPSSGVIRSRDGAARGDSRCRAGW